MVTRWMRSVALPQSSVTRYVRVIISGHVLPSLRSSHFTTGVLQLSLADTSAILGAGTLSLHWTVAG
jgi:hypothetical protein